MASKSIAIIPARGGSKRIPKKNIKEFFGKPLIAYSIEVALASNLFDKVVVTTDDENIALIAKEYGADVPFIRPKELSDDFTGTGAVVEHAVNYLESQGEKYDYICTIYATAPLLQKEYLIQGFEQLKNSDAKRAFSVTTMPFPIQRTFKVNQDGRCEMFTPKHFMARSQDLEEAYQDAGQFYWENRNITSNEIAFGKDSIPIVLPRHLVQDIDTLEDWKRVELMYQALHQDIYDNWNNLKKRLSTNNKRIHIRNSEIYFTSIGHNIGYEAYGKDELFLRPVLVYKKLTHSTFIGIPLTSKPKSGSYYFKFSYKKDKYSYASLNQLKVFDTKRIVYKSGNIKKDDFDKLKDQMKKFIDITPHSKKSGRGITPKKEQRSNKSSISKYKRDVNKLQSPKILTKKDIKSYIESLNNTCVQSCYLFGSYSKDTANLFSDIDILLIFKDTTHKQIDQTIIVFKKYFQELGYICNPIYTYSTYLRKDSNILIRQYIKNGTLLFGDDLSLLLPFESNEELKQKEYKDYWQANYLRKLETITIVLNDKNERYNILDWQYIYQVLYWYAKAELTLLNKQNSLNEYTLNYIYQVLLNKDLESKCIDFLTLVDSYREKFHNEEYVEEDISNPKESLQYLLKLIEKEDKNVK